MRDRSAKKKKSNNWLRDISAVTIVALTGAGSYLTLVKDVGMTLLGLSGSLIPSIIVIAGIIWCFVIITSKEQKHEAGFAQKDLKTLQYVYVQPVRHLSKITLLFFLLYVLPLNINKALVERIPLASVIYGNLVDARTGDPVIDARIRILTSDGIDVTKGEWFTDSRGFFIVETKSSIYRDAILAVFPTDCSKEIHLPLLSSFEVSVSETALNLPEGLDPMFQHQITCNEL